MLIKPLDFGEKLKWARGRIATDRGPISVEWKRGDGGYELQVDLPTNVVATVEIPAGAAAEPALRLDGAPIAFVRRDARLVVAVGSGSHRLVRIDAGKAR